MDGGILLQHQKKPQGAAPREDRGRSGDGGRVIEGLRGVRRGFPRELVKRIGGAGPHLALVQGRPLPMQGLRRQPKRSPHKADTSLQRAGGFFKVRFLTS